MAVCEVYESNTRKNCYASVRKSMGYSANLKYIAGKLVMAGLMGLGDQLKDSTAIFENQIKLLPSIIKMISLHSGCLMHPG